MAQKVLVQLIDDLDGVASEDVSTILFGLDGVTYEIDLSESNAERLRDSLAEFVEPARRTGGRIKRGLGVQGQLTSAGSRNGKSGKAAVAGSKRIVVNAAVPAGVVREWARKQKMEISARGRIPEEIYAQYNEAHKIN